MNKSNRIGVILLVCGISLSLIGFALSPESLDDSMLTHSSAKSLDPFVKVVGKGFYLYGKPFIPKAVCYYPRDYGWTRMWENFWSIQDVIEEDMLRMKALGINTVRIYITYPAFNSTPNNWDLKKIDRMLEIIDKYDMKAIVTLLEWSNPAGNLTNHTIFVRTIVNAFKDDPRVFAWDVRVGIDNFYYGGWKPYIPKPQIISYLKAIIDEIRSIDRNHLVCVGEYGWYLGDRWTLPGTALQDDFNDGNYDGWTVVSGSWSASGGRLVGLCLDRLGTIYHLDNSWWNKRGVNISVNVRTYESGSESWMVGTIYFRYKDPGNTYMVLLHTNGTLELAKIQNGVLYSWLAKANTSMSPNAWHTFVIINFRNETEIYVDGKKYIYYWDSNPLTEGGIALSCPYCYAAFDDVIVKLGPQLIDENIHKYCDFVAFNWFHDYTNLYNVIILLNRSYNKPVMILRMGLPTAGVYDDGTPVPHNESTVAIWMRGMLNTIKSFYGYVSPCVMRLLDISETGAPFLPPNNYARFYGLYRLDYTLKPSGEVYRDEYAGTVIINNATIVSAQHASVMKCNSTNQINITVKNTGFTYWNSSRGYKLGAKEPHVWKISSVNLTRTVYPEENYTFSFYVRAPWIPGKYSFSWRMMRESVEWFGDQYNGAIKVRDPSMNEIIDDEFVNLANWTVLQGQASISQSHLVIQSGGCVIGRSKYSDITISYRGYSSAVSGWQKSIVLAKIHRDLNNYLGFTIYGNGYAEIFYVYNGNLYSNLSGVQTNINPNEYHTYFITITDKDMRVYVDASLILSADISSYPYYNSGDYIGFYSPSSSSFIDHSAIYQKQANETFSIPTLLLVALIAMIFCGGFTKNHN